MVIDMKEALIIKIMDWFTYAPIELIDASFAEEMFSLDDKSLSEVINFYKKCV